MTDNFPPLTPTWAAKVWATDAWLYMELASPTKHTVRFHNDPAGLALALAVLNKRTSESRIGEKGEPTQWKLDQVSKSKEALRDFVYDERLVKVAKPKVAFSTEARAAARDILRKVGIL